MNCSQPLFQENGYMPGSVTRGDNFSSPVKWSPSDWVQKLKSNWLSSFSCDFWLHPPHCPQWPGGSLGGGPLVTRRGLGRSYFCVTGQGTKPRPLALGLMPWPVSTGDQWSPEVTAVDPASVPPQQGPLLRLPPACWGPGGGWNHKSHTVAWKPVWFQFRHSVWRASWWSVWDIFYWKY